MLKKADRINKTRDLQKVYRLGKAVHSSALVIKFVGGERSQAAFVVSKKVSKKAVERNRIKRVLREVFRLSLAQRKKGRYLIMVKPTAAKLKAQELRVEISKALDKIR